MEKRLLRDYPIEYRKNHILWFSIILGSNIKFRFCIDNRDNLFDSICENGFKLCHTARQILGIKFFGSISRECSGVWEYSSADEVYKFENVEEFFVDYLDRICKMREGTCPRLCLEAIEVIKTEILNDLSYKRDKPSLVKRIMNFLRR